MIKITTKLSDLFGKPIFNIEGQQVGKVFDLVINLEKGRIETITTEPLKAKTKQEAKKIISEKSVPYAKVVSVKDIIIISSSADSRATEGDGEKQSYSYRYRRGRK